MFEETTLIIDACGERVKMSLAKNGEQIFETVSDRQAIESAAQCALALPLELREIRAYAICTGPGSMLGTRFASAFASTIAKLSDAEIFEWDAMLAAAHAIADGGEAAEFSLVAPSRRGFANIVNFANGGVELEAEVELERLEGIAKQKKFLLRQRKSDFDFEEFDPSPRQLFETLKKHPELAKKCELPPDAKPLSKREYVKWRGQAHI